MSGGHVYESEDGRGVVESKREDQVPLRLTEEEEEKGYRHPLLSFHGSE